MDYALSKYLSDKNIQYEEYKHSAVFTVSESKNLKKTIPGLHCKTLFLKDSEEIFYLIGMPADKRLDIKKLRKEFKVKKLHFASADELWNKLKLKPGSVSILG